MHFSMSRVTGGLLVGMLFYGVLVMPRWALGVRLDASMWAAGLGIAVMAIWQWPAMARGWVAIQQRTAAPQGERNRLFDNGKFWLIAAPVMILWGALLVVATRTNIRSLVVLLAVIGFMFVVGAASKWLERQTFSRPEWVSSILSGLAFGIVIPAALIISGKAPLDWPRLAAAAVLTMLLFVVIGAAVSATVRQWFTEQGALPPSVEQETG